MYRYIKSLKYALPIDLYLEETLMLSCQMNQMLTFYHHNSTTQNEPIEIKLFTRDDILINCEL